MRLKPHILALASILAIGSSVAPSGPARAGDGFARYLRQQARVRDQARLLEQTRVRDQARLLEQGQARNRSSAPKSAGVTSRPGTVSHSARPGTTRSPSTR
jgi:hypothetical protein